MYAATGHSRVSASIISPGTGAAHRYVNQKGICLHARENLRTRATGRTRGNHDPLFVNGQNTVMLVGLMGIRFDTRVARRGRKQGEFSQQGKVYCTGRETQTTIFYPILYKRNAEAVRKTEPLTRQCKETTNELGRT